MEEAQPAKAAEQQSPAAWKLLLELAGAAAGIVVFLHLVGGVVMAARLAALDLPVDTVVTAVPREMLLAVGVKSLILGLLLGLAVVLILWIDDETGEKRRAGRVRSGLIAVLLIVPVVVIQAFLFQPLEEGRRWLALMLGVGVFALAVLILSRAGTIRTVSYSLFLLMACLGAALGLMRAAGPPVVLDSTSIQFKDGARSGGFLLADSSDLILLIPSVEDKTIGQIVELPRDQVASLSIDRTSTKVSPIGVEAPRALISDRPTLGGEPRDKGVLEFLANVRRSAEWRYPPRLFENSISYLHGHTEEFLSSRRNPWRAGARAVDLKRLLDEAPLYTGRPIATEGRVIAVRNAPIDKRVDQFVVIAASGNKKGRADCWLTRSRSEMIREGDRIQLRALVLAAGRFITAAGRQRDSLALACSAARPPHTPS